MKKKKLFKWLRKVKLRLCFLCAHGRYNGCLVVNFGSDIKAEDHGVYDYKKFKIKDGSG